MRPRLAAAAATLTFAAALTAPATIAAQPSVNIDSSFTRREVMIPMRDGKALFTVILTPKSAAGRLPIILSRTPYGTAGWGGTSGIGYGFRELMEDGYIFAFQDIRGRFQSQGSFEMNRPLRDKRDPKSVDETTDTWDTIDWLVKQLPNNNGRVGMVGISYPGWLANMAAIEPHPALKAVSPQATMGDAWMGDDFFHQGAFRLSYGFEYSWELESVPGRSTVPAPSRYDTYDWYRSFPTLDSLARAVMGSGPRWPTWQRFVDHPSYDAVWRARSLPQTVKQTAVPTLTVGGWWDQEDMYGPQATYAAIEPSDAAHRNYIAIGPWSHGQWFEEAADSLGKVKFGSATGEYFRREIQAPWFAYYLKDKGTGRFPEARMFDAGDSTWRSYDAWPPANAHPSRLYLRGGGRLAIDAAPQATEGHDSFLSDPAHPVPYRPRPIETTYDPRGSHWAQWLVEDQRFVDGRSDVLTWQTDRLDHDVRVAGEITAHLFAGTTGSDADWVVKLIDVYPDSLINRPSMGGYELMIAADVLRGRYRQSFVNAEPIVPNAVQPYTVDLHAQAYTFKKGHRLMVQVQSTWFPLYDRNPQTFVPNIFKAKASDYRPQTHSIYHDAAHASYVEIPVIP
jgi:uncharacterized protein